jgi:hypothetical protein
LTQLDEIHFRTWGIYFQGQIPETCQNFWRVETSQHQGQWETDAVTVDAVAFIGQATESMLYRYQSDPNRSSIDMESMYIDTELTVS